MKEQIAACRKCVEEPAGKPLPHEPRPVCVMSETARIRIIGQAPGTRVHQSGKPFTDPSGDRLRAWMDVDDETFYDPALISITPMGFCFPGLDAKGGDLPPRKECRTLWHDRIDVAMPQIELVLLIGQYAQRHYLGGKFGKSVTETVGNWRSVLESNPNPAIVPLPHPSWRNNSWIKRHDWFDRELLPELRRLVRSRL